MSSPSRASAYGSFPDDPTTDRFFDDGRFEAYRRLGEHQMSVDVASAAWTRALDWRDQVRMA